MLTDRTVLLPFDTDLNGTDLAPAGQRPLGAEGTSVRVGTLLALSDGGTAAFVGFPGQIGPAAVRARCTVDLLSAHVGAQVLLAFEDGDCLRPIVVGLLRGQNYCLASDTPSRVRVEVDGHRLTVSAEGELVLRCGRSQITLRADGQLELRAEVIVSQAAEVNRIRGGSIQLN